jgi:hypothetical protein
MPFPGDPLKTMTRDESVRVGLPDRPFDHRLADSFSPERDVVHKASPEDEHILHHQTDAATKFALGPFPDIEPVQKDPALHRIEETLDKVDHGGLSAPVVPTTATISPDFSSKATSRRTGVSSRQLS